MSFAERAIGMTLQIGTGPLGEGKQQTVALPPGLRIHAAISCGGAAGGTTASIRVFGLPLGLLNQISTMGYRHQTRRNTVTLTAGDAIGSGIAFVGSAFDAYADFGSPPEMALQILAIDSAIPRVDRPAASSFSGTVSVATILQTFATGMGLKLENNGVTASLSNPYFSGSTFDQVVSCTKAAGVSWTVDERAGVLAIWPRGGNRSGGPVVISPETGLIGYPSYQMMGPIVRTRFNPALRFGGQIEVQSAVTPANGVWNIIGLDYELESQTPDGAWEARVTCQRPGQM